MIGKLLTCRTLWRGARRGACQDAACGFEEIVPRACQDRQCMLCGAVEEARWIGARATWLLPVPHLHAVLTLPGRLRDLAWHNKAAVYRLLLDAAVGAIEARLGLALGVPVGAGEAGGPGDRPLPGAARPALTAVLHTWNRELAFHPHVHALVAAGALSADGSRWITAPGGACALPADERLRELFRDRLLEGLDALRRAGKLRFPRGLARLAQDAAWAALLAALRRDPARPGRRAYWHVYAKTPLGGRDVLVYLARYAVRIGLSWSRLLEHDRARREVVIATRRGQALRLTGRELARRIALHALPRGFVRVRHRGLYLGRQRAANAQAHARIVAQGLAEPMTIDPADPLSVFVLARAAPGADDGRAGGSTGDGSTGAGARPATKKELRAASRAAEEATRAAGETSGTGSSLWDLYAQAKWGVDFSRCTRCGKALVFSFVPPRRDSLPAAAAHTLARARTGLAPRAPPVARAHVEAATT